MGLLEIKGLKTHFKTDDGWLHAVDGVDISIERGQTVCVVGESGCGKTVTAMTVLKLLPMPPGKIVAGQVLWQGKDLVTASSDEMRRVRAKEIAIIFQEPMTSLNPVTLKTEVRLIKRGSDYHRLARFLETRTDKIVDWSPGRRQER